MLGPQTPSFLRPRGLSRRLPYVANKRDDAITERTKWWGPDRHIVIYYTKKDRSEVDFVTSVPEPVEWMTAESGRRGDVREPRRRSPSFTPTCATC